jgi:hypothetical protein
MKLLGQADQLGLASPLKYAAIQSAKTKGPSSRQAALDASDQPRVPFEGHGEEFFLDILFNGMSRVEKRRSDVSLPVAVGQIFTWPPQSGLT